jgi:D-3-phosphoglycerate dehydrogenase
MIMITGRVSAGQDALRDGVWRDELEPGTLVNRKTIGIIGYGDIGSRLATLLTGFTVDVLAYDPYVEEIDTDYGGATLTDLDDLLSRSDVVSVNAELTPETNKLISDDELALLGSEGFIVNTARGPIIDESALLRSLRNDEIAGAALDVFEEEPLPADSELHSFDNVITTPHIAGVRTEVREKTSLLLAKNAVALLSGEPVSNRFMAVAP